jgi:gamma-butyrobetaine dioxygenase
VLSTPLGLWQWLDGLMQHGAVLLTEAPTVLNQVQLLAERISHAQPTIYGTVFDVRAEPNPINLAYSNAELALHQVTRFFCLFCL